MPKVNASSGTKGNKEKKERKTVQFLFKQTKVFDIGSPVYFKGKRRSSRNFKGILKKSSYKGKKKANKNVPNAKKSD